MHGTRRQAAEHVRRGRGTSVRVRTCRWVAVRVGTRRRGLERVWQGLAHVEDVRDVLGRGMNIQEEAGEAVGASRCIRVVLEVVGQRWASRDASGSVGSAWGCVRRQGGLDGSGARCVGRVGVLRHVVSGRRGGRQGGRVRGGWRHVEDTWVVLMGQGTSAAR